MEASSFDVRKSKIRYLLTSTLKRFIIKDPPHTLLDDILILEL